MGNTIERNRLIVVANIHCTKFLSHAVVGEAPVFLTQQEDVVVSSDVYLPIGTTSANLVLPCNVSRVNNPTIQWFMEGVQVPDESVSSDGTLFMNVTEGVGVTRSGTRFYCLASTLVGSPSRPATSRSRDVIVSYACECTYIG